MARLFSLEEIVRVTKGRLQGGMTDRGHACSVVIDSRKARRDCLFVALSGSKTNGHEYLQEAVQGGASICLVERREWNARKARVASLLAGRRAAAVEVSDTLLALQDLALFHLERFPGLLRIGITGSNGKTTTKEIVGCILSQAAETVVNEGNLNSETGLPLSAFRVSRHHRYAVFEMAMNHEGEMDGLSRIVKPAAALITNIGSAHIEFFGSRRRIALEKKKIFKYFSGKEMGFIHEAEPYFNFLENEVKGTIIPFGPKSTEGYRGSMDLGLDGTSIDWEGLQVHFPLFGYHNLLNALAAITLTQNLGVPPVSIRRGLENVQPLFGRSQIIRGCITIIQDCYNANPESMRTVLEIFDSLS